MKWLQFLQTTHNIAEGICCSNKLVNCPTQLQFEGASTDKCLATQTTHSNETQTTVLKRSVEAIDIYQNAL